MEKKEVSVVLITHNRLERFIKSFESLIQTLSLYDELIIWDNASTDGTQEYLHKKLGTGYLNVKVIYNHKNIGLSAINRSFKLMKHKYLVVCDDDITEIPPNWKEKLVEVFEKIPKAGFISASLKNHQDLPQKFFQAYENPEIYKRVEIEGIKLRLGDASGGFVMTTKDVYNDVGDTVEMHHAGTTYFNWDSEYSERCRQKGYLVGFREDVKIFHAFGEKFNKPFEKDYIAKLCSWLYQPGIRRQPREVKRKYLIEFSVSPEMADKIIDHFETNYIQWVEAGVELKELTDV